MHQNIFAAYTECSHRLRESEMVMLYLETLVPIAGAIDELMSA